VSDKKFAAADNAVFYSMLALIIISLLLVTWLIVGTTPECSASNYTYCGGMYYDPSH